MTRTLIVGLTLLALLVSPVAGQEPVAWGDSLIFHTFSIAAIDPSTGEVGVAVTTRNACVGNGVPWVRAGVGAVATQSFTRTAYGNELLDMIAGGMSADEALRQATARDEGEARRQIGVIALDGSKGQHTGDSSITWAGHRSGTNFVTQGNLLVGPEVVDAVAASFESTEGSGRHLADRLIEALWAGQQMGGDRRKGRLQSAAVIVADTRDGMSRRPDQISAHINVCQHATPVMELRRIYDTISQSLGYRELMQFSGNDVWQLRVLMHAIGAYRSDLSEIPRNREMSTYSQELVEAVDAFRVARGLNTSRLGSPIGLVDRETVNLLWELIEQAGKTLSVRELIRDATAVRR